MFPRASADGIAMMMERARRRLERTAPHLSKDECLRILGEIALLERVVEGFEGFREILARFQRPPAKRSRWRAPTPPVEYSPAPGDASSFTSRGRRGRLQARTSAAVIA